LSIYHSCIKGYPFSSTTPPNHVPISIRSRLQELIHQADTNATDITPTRIITGNYSRIYIFSI